MLNITKSCALTSGMEESYSSAHMDYPSQILSILLHRSSHHLLYQPGQTSINQHQKIQHHAKVISFCFYARDSAYQGKYFHTLLTITSTASPVISKSDSSSRANTICFNWNIYLRIVRNNPNFLFNNHMLCNMN